MHGLKFIQKLAINKKIVAVIVGSVFFVVSILTISDYNIMWDARNHFFKGQAFANYFLSGRTDYKDLSITKEYARYYRDYAKSFTPQMHIEQRLSNDPNYRRSIYQDEVHDFNWLMERPPTEHPVISDIGSAFFNILFYEKLGWLRDDHAYGLFAIFLASVLVGVVFYWMSKSYGFFAAVISTIVLATTPLFWAESHFNIKDIPLLVFFSLSVWAFWTGVKKYSVKWIIFSSVLGGLALGTKFNSLFLPVIIFPWAIVYWFFQDKIRKKNYVLWWWYLPAFPLIMVSILVIGWPQMWGDPIGSFVNVVNYYKSVGLNVDYTPQFRTIFNFSTYPLLWIFYTTYPYVLFLALIGIISWIFKFKKTKDLLPLLFIIWLLVPILRASLPNTSIFGGVRHIIEYIVPLSMLAGYGANEIIKLLTSYIKKNVKRFRRTEIRRFIGVGIILLFIPFVSTLIRLHPAENVYFNSFIGGLKGAKDANLTGWGNTDGGIYRIAVEWINKNAEKNSHLAVGFSELADFYLPEFREDLLADNQFSGYLQKGEYIIALTHNSELEHTYRMLYPENFLKPLYEYMVDGVPLIKIWKNERKYLREQIAKLTEEKLMLEAERVKEGLRWDLGESKKIVSLEISFEENANCDNLESAYLQVSDDNKKWRVFPETYPTTVIDTLGEYPRDDLLMIPVAGIDARYIWLVAEPENTCIKNVKESTIFILAK